MIFLLLFLEYFKIGLFAIGGGLATLPFLFQLADKYPSWLTYGDISTLLAVSESTPGAIGVNMATYCGSQVAGVFGALCSTIGLVTPSIIIILLVANILDKFKGNIWIKRAFYGLRAAVIALIAYAGWCVIKITIFDGQFNIQPKQLIMMTIILILMLKCKKISPIVWIALSAVAGIVLQL